MMPMQPTQAVNMVEGPPIEPSGPLLDWLNQNARSPSGERMLFRLPVVVRFQDPYRLAIGSASIGASLDGAAADAIALKIDDTGMSVSLLTRLRDLCPPGAEGCALWLEGYWGRLVEVPDLLGGGPSARKPFAVLRVGEVIDPTAQQVSPLRAFIECDRAS